MKIAGIVKSSLIDYPGKASTVIFLGGCNFRCGYCHNPDIVFREDAETAATETAGDGAYATGIPLPVFFDFLERRRRFLDAVCITGGEPTISPELYELVRQIKEKGFAVKLDTNGSSPELLDRLFSEGLLDYVAMDIKGPFRKYPRIIGARIQDNEHDKKNDSDNNCRGSLESLRASGRETSAYRLPRLPYSKHGNLINAVQESSRLLRAGTCPYEFRTTVCREQLSGEDLREMIGEHPGAAVWFLQSYRDSGKRIDPEGRYSAYSKEEMEELGVRLCVSVR